MSNFHLREPVESSQPRIKTPPEKSSIPVPFTYTPSDDGTDENLLILLHGLGDTHIPFSALGKSLKLPQTATLALRAPQQIPYLYESAYQWYPAFDPLGDPLPPHATNPSPGIELLSTVISHLTDLKSCGWHAERIHIFGFGQGGTVAVETGLKHKSLGSIVSISGPLISFPTFKKEDRRMTPLLIFHRTDEDAALPTGAIAALKKGFANVSEIQNSGDGMPRSHSEWQPIMRFWSEHLGRRNVQGLYEVMSGSSA